jgi:hypothetical protein
MVCISCILIPLAIFIWHKFLQPIFGRFWTPSWDKKIEGADPASTAAKCPFSGASNSTASEDKAACPASGATKKTE